METESRKQNLDKSAMYLFGESGMTILPWTKQILCVLWEQLRFLVHLIYYSFMSVFQMFRLEVHLRISEETGPRIQHMTTPGNPGEGFFLSSLFDNNKSVLVSSSSPLSKLSSDLTGTHPLLSSLVSDELCCSLVDDFVARAAEGFSDTEELNIGQHASWKLGCPGEWNVFVGSEHSSGSNSSCCSKDFYSRSLHEDKVFSWENDASGKNESASPSCDPYSPLSFSASIFSYSPKESTEPVETSSWEFRVKSSASFEDSHALFCPAFGGRSDSESSWWSSDSSADGDREESEKLWDLFTSSSDPYHPLHFSACASSTKPTKKDTNAAPRPEKVIKPPTELPSFPTDTESIGPSCLSEDEEEALWQSLCYSDDPYHPLHFKACIRSPSSDANTKSSVIPGTAISQNPANACSDSTLDSALEFSPSAFQTLTKSKKPRLLRKRRSKGHCCSGSPDKPVFVPWRRKVKSKVIEEHEVGRPAVKKVQFSPQVQVHKIRAWSFAHQASRKGHWEELARDRDRFRRRIHETEQAIGYCLSQAHREKILAREQKAWNTRKEVNGT